MFTFLCYLMISLFASGRFGFLFGLYSGGCVVLFGCCGWCLGVLCLECFGM